MSYEIEVTTVSKNMLKSGLPKSLRSSVSDELVDTINGFASTDGELMAEMYRENFVSYLSVMHEGRFKITDYMKAVKYCGFKLMGSSNIDAYMKTFPNRYARLLKDNSEYTEEHVRNFIIAPYVLKYNSGTLVNKIMSQTLIPTHILNAPLYQQALNVQVDLMLNAKSETVRSNAADSVMVATKAPETARIEIDMTIEKSDAVAELNEALAALAFNQKTEIDRGQVSVKELGSLKVKSSFIDADIDEVYEADEK